MTTANDYLNRMERDAVEQAVAAAEECTSAEIVCAVATESGRYDRAESLCGLVLGLIAMGVVQGRAGFAPAESGSWAAQGAAIGWLALAVVAGFVAGSILASYWHGLRRLLVSEHEMEEEVAGAAARVFALERIGSTRGKAGVLLYVSLAERRVVVLADAAAMTLLGRQGLDELRDMAVTRLRDGRRADTFVDTIIAAAKRLAPALPPETGDANELANRLRLYHPRP